MRTPSGCHVPVCRLILLECMSEHCTPLVAYRTPHVLYKHSTSTRWEALVALSSSESAS
jgi:hypothetical protein